MFHHNISEGTKVIRRTLITRIREDWTRKDWANAGVCASVFLLAFLNIYMVQKK